MNRENNSLRFLLNLGFGICVLLSTSLLIRNLPKKSQLEKNHDKKRLLQTSDVSKEYKVTWDIDIGGKDSLLESGFLKAGLEYGVKVYINRQLECEEEDVENLENTAFFHVSISNSNDQGKFKRVSGNGTCKGDRTRCKKKIKKSISDAGKQSQDEDTFDNLTFTKNDLCKSSIFDLFRDTLITASFFNYNVTLDVINDLAGNLAVDLNVFFQESSDDGLDQINFVSFEAEEPMEQSYPCDSNCLEQRQNQRLIIAAAFSNLGIPFEDNRHECLFEGINCNEQNLVTHIWLSKYTYYI